MAKDPCKKFTPDLSAYADGTLPPKRWEQVSYHLAGCESCREDVNAINQVCSTLSAAKDSRTPDSLTSRLESIAGEQATMPLYMALGDGDLPSLRRKRAVRAAQGGVALLAVVFSAVVIAVLVAPSPAKIATPVKDAREQYSRSLTAISVNEAVGAMLLAQERGADFGGSEPYEPRLAETQSVDISRELAANLLRRAADTDHSLSGIQQVWAKDRDGGYRTAAVRTAKVHGYGAHLEVLDVRGNQFSSSFLPDRGAAPVEAPWGWEYVRSTTFEQVSGRDTVRIQANGDGQPIAKWWVDADTGAMVWSERYDALGRVNLAVGYTEVSFDDVEVAPDDSTQLISLNSPEDAHEDAWCRGFDQCPREAGGLTLVAHSSSGEPDAPSMNLVYSDGYHTAVVGWTSGVLQDRALIASDRAAEMAVEVWQSGGAVISVACDCPPALLNAIVDELPGPEPYEQGLGEKVADGLARLAGVG